MKTKGSNSIEDDDDDDDDYDEEKDEDDDDEDRATQYSRRLQTRYLYVR